MALWTAVADNPTLCELVRLHKGAIVESGGPGKVDWVWAGWRRVWRQESQQLDLKHGSVLLFEPTRVLSQLGIWSRRNAVALKHVSVLVIIYNIEYKIENDFPIRPSVSLD